MSYLLLQPAIVGVRGSVLHVGQQRTKCRARGCKLIQAKLRNPDVESQQKLLLQTVGERQPRSKKLIRLLRIVQWLSAVQIDVPEIHEWKRVLMRQRGCGAQQALFGGASISASQLNES